MGVDEKTNVIKRSKGTSGYRIRNCGVYNRDEYLRGSLGLETRLKMESKQN